MQAYNAQAAVDSDSHIVVAATPRNRPVDAPHLQELTSQTSETTGRTPKVYAADAGCCSDANVRHVEASGAEALIPPDRVPHSEWRAQQSPTGRIPKDTSAEDRMRRKLATKRVKRLYLHRQASVDPVFGTTKTVRGLQQFLHRGLEKNLHLFRFDMAVHNVMKIIRHLQRAPKPPKTTRSSTKLTRAGARAAAATA